MSIVQQQPYDLGNPYRTPILRYAQQLLGERYGLYHDVLLRVTNVVVTEKDATDFGQMLLDIYHAGFTKAVEDYKEAVQKHGLRVEIKQG